ncbi:ornithine cyclodeaminase [Microbacterium sp. kSW2-24]|uniref:tyramine oxidase subunit B n=1 Tax=Microbacterium galbinum TaxID=2851646 RepID=UPI001FFCF3A8|nr:tyramine oxidase subunit B [Microbacterium galbinum]MCK2023345.1 ornithine cyclodeaminase [Microbacterium galbinum]
MAVSYSPRRSHPAQAQATNPTAIDFLYLSEPDMVAAGVTDMPACVDTMEETLQLLHSGDYRMAGVNSDSHGAMMTFPENSPFPGMPEPTADRRFMAMPAYLGGSFGTTGVKWYGSNIANRDHGLPRSILMFLLSDTVTAAPLALMSANLLSAYRTGAVPGVGARHLARHDARTVGIAGPGVMARTSLAAFVAARPGITTVKVKGRGRRSLDDFTQFVRSEFPSITDIIEVDTFEEVVRDSDIVTYCTSAATGDPAGYPLVRREWVKPGAFLSMPAACNIDEAMEESDVRKVADHIGLYEAWADEVPSPAHHHIPVIGCKFMDLIAQGRMARDSLESLGAIAAGDAPGRNDDEIIILSVGGLPVEDVAWGTVVYREAVRRQVGVPLHLWDSPVLA